MAHKEPTLLDLVNKAAWEYRGEDRCRGCIHWRYEGKHEDDCYWGNMIKLVKSLDEPESQKKPKVLFDGKSLPVVSDTPPMPKCKPPKKSAEELEEEMFALNDAVESLDGPKEIKIESAEQISQRMIDDGDLREHEFHEPYICCEGDDLGFYQQACELLLKEIDNIQTCKEGHKFVAKSHEYVCPICSLDKIRNMLK